MGNPAVVSGAFRYPGPGSFAALQGEVAGMSPSAARNDMGRFVGAIAGLDIGEWEELHTRTLDLSPLFVPYVGHAMWGENYRRGEFMAELKGVQREAGIDPAGELPDHIEPILRYLDSVSDPLPDLLDVLPAAVETMIGQLKKAESDNPYRHLLAAVAHVVDDVVAATAAPMPGART
ncbi:MAG TPA: nitrate reductase [Acidimicrobiia bacterium]|nr:nitrate reductase [Acidimicrobiia bacterium]